MLEEFVSMLIDKFDKHVEGTKSFLFPTKEIESALFIDWFVVKSKMISERISFLSVANIGVTAVVVKLRTV
tara:strand:+ start:191 stop:403 length:213 start_codon:yes stop_codon:yes gene_type:complete